MKMAKKSWNCSIRHFTFNIFTLELHKIYAFFVINKTFSISIKRPHYKMPWTKRKRWSWKIEKRKNGQGKNQGYCLVGGGGSLWEPWIDTPCSVLLSMNRHTEWWRSQTSKTPPLPISSFSHLWSDGLKGRRSCGVTWCKRSSMIGSLYSQQLHMWNLDRAYGTWIDTS